MENFFGHLKSEFYYVEKFQSADEFIEELKNYIEYYNNNRGSLHDLALLFMLSTIRYCFTFPTQYCSMFPLIT